MSQRFTIFTTCKPFQGEAAGFQRKALETWSRLDPSSDVLVIGGEQGVRECCGALGLRHHPNVKRNQWGTPLLDSLFRIAEEASASDVLCYVNADILLTSELPCVLERARTVFDRFLVIGRRWNVETAKIRDYDPSNGEAALVDLARRFGCLEPSHGGVDIFAFPRGFWRTIPPYLVGRGRWDSGLILEARRMKAPVIDATSALTAVHPAHDYKRPEPTGDASLRTEEMRYNARLLGGPECIFSAVHATHVATRAGFMRNRAMRPAQLARRLATLPALHPIARPAVPAIRWLTAVVRRLQPDINPSERPWKFEEATKE
jgi:hypothetical protein